MHFWRPIELSPHRRAFRQRGDSRFPRRQGFQIQFRIQIWNSNSELTDGSDSHSQPGLRCQANMRAL